MKPITLILIAVIALSCGNNNNPNVTAHWIPNWATDTLIAIYQETQNSPMKFDTIYSFTISEKSCIKYKGVTYYVWTKPSDQFQNMSPNWFEQDAQQYSFCYIGTAPFDNNSAILGGTATGAIPHKYYDAHYQNMKTQHQGLYFSPRKPPLPDNVFAGGNLYTTANKYP